MILSRKSPGAYENNAFQAHNVSGFETCDDLLIATASYVLAVDTGTVTSASKISLGGTEYDFESAITLGTAAAAMKLKTAIRAVLFGLGYDNRSVTVTQDGTTLMVETGLSEIKFDYLEVAGNAFQAKVARTHGDFKGEGDKSETLVGARISGTNLSVSVAATVGVTSINVTGANVTTFSGSPARGIANTPTTVAAGASTSLTVVVTYDDATTASFTVPVTNFG